VDNGDSPVGNRDSVSIEKLGSEIRRNESGEVIQITFRLGKISDDELAKIGELASLESLTIQECTKVTDASLEAIAKLPKLSELRLSRISCSDQGIEELAIAANLKVLWLENTGISAKCLKHLSGLPLTSLRLEGDKIDSDGIGALSNYTNLQELYVTSSQLKLQNFPSLLLLKELKELHLRKVVVTDESVARFAGLPELQILEFDASQISDSGLASISKSNRIQVLRLGKSQTTDDGLKFIAEMQELERIELGARHTDAGLTHLAKLKSLKQISALGTRVTGAGFNQLLNLNQLEIIDLESTAVTASGRKAARTLRQAIPTCVIYAWSGDSAEEL
jgi:Leucine-rich repeat (LRR) protein